MAHPDDAEFLCGATFAKWAAHGCVINHLICTDGSKGTWDAEADTKALVRTRQAEQRHAARILGSTGEVVFLDAVDGELEATLARRSEVAYWIRVLQPDVVVGHDPWRRWRLHPDHRAAGFLACDGIVVARDPHFYGEHGVAHHRPNILLLFESEEPNHVENVTGYAKQKIEALLAHQSQLRSTMFIEDGDRESHARFRATIEQELAAAGQLAGVAQAEAFRRFDAL